MVKIESLSLAPKLLTNVLVYIMVSVIFHVLAWTTLNLRLPHTEPERNRRRHHRSPRTEQKRRAAHTLKRTTQNRREQKLTSYVRFTRSYEY